MIAKACFDRLSPIHARVSDLCLMLDYVRVINFRIIIITIIIFCPREYKARGLKTRS